MTRTAPRLVFRPDWSAYAAAALGVFISLKLLLSAAGNSDPVLTALGLSLGVACLVGAVLLVQRVVIADRHGLTIRNMFTRRKLNWTDIDHFELGRKDPLPLVGIAVLHNGRTVGMSVIQPPNPLFRARNRRAQEAIATLNEYLAWSAPAPVETV